MANRVPLIINTTANQIQELAVGDSLDLTASGIHNAGVITATKFVGDGSLLTNIGGGASALQDLVDDVTPQLGGNLDINGKVINGSGSISISGGVQATSFTGNVIGNLTGNVLGNADTATTANTATTATSAAGLTGSPAIQVASIVVSGNILADTVSVASTLTYEDVTNIDSVGVVTARTGIKVLANGIDAVGVVTATAFSGDGSGLTNLPPSGILNVVEDTTPQLGGDLDLNGKSILGTTTLGIGTDVISGKLDVNGAIYAQDRASSSGAQLSSDGALEIWRPNSDAYIDFKTGIGEDFDCRIQQASNGINFVTGGNGNSTQVALEVLSGGDVKASSGSVYDIKGELRTVFNYTCGTNGQLSQNSGGCALSTGNGLYIEARSAGFIQTVINDKGTQISLLVSGIDLYYTADGTLSTASNGVVFKMEGRGMATFYWKDSTTVYMSGTQIST